MISVAAAETALILGAFNLFIFMASRVQKWCDRRRKRKEKFAAKAVELAPCDMKVSDNTHTPTDLDSPCQPTGRDELLAV